MIGTVNKNYISSISMLDQREILNQLVDRTNEDSTLMDVLSLDKRMVVTGNPTYHNFVNEELYQLETVKTGTTPSDNSGGSGQGDVTFLTTRVSGASSFRKGDLLLLASGYLVYVFSKNNDAGGDVIRVKAVSSSVTTANLAIAADQTIAAVSRAEGEGSGAPDPIRYGMSKQYNQVQIIKEAYEITDVERANKIETTFGGKPYIFYKGQHDAFRKFMAHCSFALLTGQISDANFEISSPTLVDSDGNGVQTTRGLDQYITDYGINDTGTISYSEYGDICRELAKQRTPKSFLVGLSTEGQIAHDNIFSSLASNPFSTQARLQINGKEVDIMVNKAKLHGYNFQYMIMPMLDHKNVLNFTGSAGYSNHIYFIPDGKVKTQKEGMLDRIRCRYMAQPDGHEMYKETHHGRLSPQQNTKVDKWEIVYSTNMGLEILGAEHFAKYVMS